MQNIIQLYRRRFLPSETIHLKDDKILFMDNQMIITKWNTLHPRNDIARGISAYYMEKGFKISKIYDTTDHIVYWYCDIIQILKQPASNSIIFEDLLLDVIIYEDGRVHVVDADEMADALEQKLITEEMACKALRTLNTLLQSIYDGSFRHYQEQVNELERE